MSPFQGLLVPVALTCSVFRPVFSNLVRRKCRYAYVTLALVSERNKSGGLRHRLHAAAPPGLMHRVPVLPGPTYACIVLKGTGVTERLGFEPDWLLDRGGQSAQVVFAGDFGCAHAAGVGCPLLDV